MFLLMKQNSLGTVVKETFNNRNDAEKERDRLHKKQINIPYERQLYYFIIDTTREMRNHRRKLAKNKKRR